VKGQRHSLAALYPRERPGTHCTGGWVGPRAGLDNLCKIWYTSVAALYSKNSCKTGSKWSINPWCHFHQTISILIWLHKVSITTTTSNHWYLSH